MPKEMGIPDAGYGKYKKYVEEVEKKDQATAKLELYRFRSRVDVLAKESQHPALKGIYTGSLTQEDQIFFQRFERGEMTLEQVLAQKRVLENIDYERVKASKQLLDYMEAMLTH